MKEKIKKTIYILVSLFTLFILIASVGSYYKYIEKEKLINKNIQKYKSNWKINSVHKCQLQKIQEQTKSSDYIITDSNRDKFIDGDITLIIGNDNLTIKYHHISIMAKQIEWVRKNKYISGRELLMYRIAYDGISPNKYGYENLEYSLDYNSLYITENNILDKKTKQYSCKKDNVE